MFGYSKPFLINAHLETLHSSGIGIRYLHPGLYSKHCISDDRIRGFEELMQKQLKIAVTYRYTRNEPYKECLPLDFREHSGK